jgi:hypothetical protein
VIIAADGRALCEVARAFTAAGVKVQRADYSTGQYVYTNVFSPSSGYDLKNWRLGYSAKNSTCAYNTSLPLYRPDWCSGWSGVGCDWNTYKVTSLDISASSWTKTSRIPTAIGALTSLQYLRLSNVGLGAESHIPTFIGTLTNLQSLTLSSMGLTGPIPNLARLTRLTGLDMTYNRLTGSVPAFVNAVYRPTQSWSLRLDKNCNLTSSVPAVSDRLYSQGNCAPPRPLLPGKLVDLSIPLSSFPSHPLLNDSTSHFPSQHLSMTLVPPKHSGHCGGGLCAVQSEPGPLWLLELEHRHWLYLQRVQACVPTQLVQWVGWSELQRRVRHRVA